MAQAPAKHGENHAHGHDHGHHDPQEMKILGFWFFLISDVILFSVLFATFIVLRDNTAGGPILSELIKMPGVIAETFILLTSSFTSGLAVLAMNQGKVKQLISWLAVTAVLGASFIALEVYEFIELIHEGFSFTTSLCFWRILHPCGNSRTSRIAWSDLDDWTYVTTEKTWYY